MPELPEVETVVRQITPAILNKLIKEVIVHEGGIRMISPLSTSELNERLRSRRFDSLSRQGKFMVFSLDNTDRIIAHLRMSGRMTATRQISNSQHNRLSVVFEDDTYLNFIDIRRFGTFHYSAKGSSYPGLLNLGPDALNVTDPKQLWKKLQKHSKSIYATLLDQSVIAGLGNIYVNEILFAIGIHPLTPAKALSLKETATLLLETKRILTLAINFRGTTLIDKSYTDSKGSYGDFYNELKAYGKVGMNCPICGNIIERIKISGRSVYYCPGHQQLDPIYKRGI